MARDTETLDPRVVSHERPAWFFCGGQSSPDYGKVFAQPSARSGMVGYYFDRAHTDFACLCPAPEGKWLEVQGRLFEIVSGAGR